MSKQIAQTVGDKRVAILIALLAAFAVLATFATQWQGSKADVTAASYTLSGPFLNGQPECTTPAPATVLVGSNVHYCVTSIADPAVVNPLQVTVTIPNFNITDLLQIAGPQPNCSGIGTNTATCTYTGLTGASTFQLYVGGSYTAVQTLVAGVGGETASLDDPSNQPPVAPANDTTTAIAVVAPDFTKNANTVTVNPDGTQDGVFGIHYLHPAGAQVIPVNFLDITDTFVPDNNSSILSVVVTNDLAGVTGVTCTVPTATSFTCTNSGATIDPLDHFDIVINIAVNANSGNTPDSHCNSARLDLLFNTPAGQYTATDGDCISQTQVGSSGTSLVHLTEPLPDGTPEGIRDHNNDVIGFRHTVCALNDVVDAIWPSIGGQGLNDASDNFQITTVSGTPTVEAPVVAINQDCDDDGFNDDSTVSWYSVGPGEQNIIVVNDSGVAQYGFSGTGAGTVPLVKEWNTLAPTQIRASAAGGTCPISSVLTDASPPAAADTITGTNLDGTTVNGTTVFNPATGEFVGQTSNFCEFPIAQHTNAAGTQLSVAYGAQVTFRRAASSTCGTISVDDEDLLSVISGPTELDSVDDVLIGISAGVGISFHFHADTGANPCTGPTGSTTVNIQVDYPTLLGSDQPPSPALETLTVKWSGAVASKQVFLAWAGQRVILEHDWRLPAGDVDGGVRSTSPEPLGDCIFDDDGEIAISYIKGSGPGNFLPGEDVELNGSDQATVLMDTSDNSQTDGEDVVDDPNGMCISRVLFESEDQGQVDIEAFVDEGDDGNAATKIAFVIYYMKINTINVSLVTQVEKPSHNSSSSSYSDYAPGNPWDASKDDADNAADWNVSKDLLVRGRVTGWFTNSNPSGRAADTTNPLNVLPANRWVMPQDWPLLAGGPADPADGTDAIGTAEQFRPYYDIMFAPNNTRGITLGNPTGTSTNQAAVVVTVTGVTNTATVFRVTTCNDLAAYQAAGGTSILVGATTVTMTSCVGTTLTVGAGLAAAPAAGTLVSILSGAPFEGPYSTIDIVGLASQGLGGAALSDADPNNIRDAALDDGDVDWWDAPMPVAPVSVAIRGTGFIKQVIKSDVYYIGTVNNAALQVYPNPYYIVDIPASPFISAQAAGGGYFWDTWGNDGPGPVSGQGVYNFWQPAITGTNSAGIGDSFTTAQTTELAAIRTAYGDSTIARDLVIYSDNHGEFMVTANGDYRTDLTACATNVLAGGKHCKPGDKVGTGTITATVDYPDFRGKHFPVLSNAATVTWTWGGYKDVTVEAGETDQFKYIVFHGLDRDGFCSPLVKPGSVSLHPVLSSWDDDWTIGAVDPVESIDFLIDSGEGIIIGQSGGGTINDGKQFATGLPTFSTIENDPAVTGIKEFPPSSIPGTVPVDECQAWIKVSNSLLGVINILAIAHDDEGNIGFDEIIDLTNTTSYTLTFRWSLITWAGADAITVSDAIKGTGTSGKNPGGNDISSQVTAIYGWEASSQTWLGYFPTGVNVPGANDLNTLENGEAYWIAIVGPSSVTWTIASNVN